MIIIIIIVVDKAVINLAALSSAHDLSAVKWK
jgi:hypothetical protein